MIPCSEKCIYQHEGYCTLAGKAMIKNLQSPCPHFEADDRGINSAKAGFEPDDKN